jgi:hypothetical protein
MSGSNGFLLESTMGRPKIKFSDEIIAKIDHDD